jgi:hypothetical protein
MPSGLACGPSAVSCCPAQAMCMHLEILRRISAHASKRMRAGASPPLPINDRVGPRKTHVNILAQETLAAHHRRAGPAGAGQPWWCTTWFGGAPPSHTRRVRGRCTLPRGGGEGAGASSSGGTAAAAGTSGVVNAASAGAAAGAPPLHALRNRNLPAATAGLINQAQRWEGAVPAPQRHAEDMNRQQRHCGGVHDVLDRPCALSLGNTV